MYEDEKQSLCADISLGIYRCVRGRPVVADQFEEARTYS